MTNRRPTPALPRPDADLKRSLDALTRAMHQELIGYAQAVNSLITQIEGFRSGILPATGPILLASYATVDLPDPTLWEGAIVYDTTTNRVNWSNGTAWGAL